MNATRTIRLFSQVSFTGLLVMLACSSSSGDGTGGPGAECAALDNQLRGCNLLAQGASSECEEPTTESLRCTAACLKKATCDDFRAMLCDNTAPSGAVTACITACPREAEFACADGMGTGDRCDGFDDCADASDEAGCPTFSCADASGTVPESYQCDGEEDCPDGSDEAGCVSPYTC